MRLGLTFCFVVCFPSFSLLFLDVFSTNSSQMDTVVGLPLLMNLDKCPGRKYPRYHQAVHILYICPSYFQLRIFSEILLTKNFRIFLFKHSNLTDFTTNFTIFIITNGDLCVTPSSIISFEFLDRPWCKSYQSYILETFFFHLSFTVCIFWHFQNFVSLIS